jgi:hypothetical protein
MKAKIESMAGRRCCAAGHGGRAATRPYRFSRIHAVKKSFYHGWTQMNPVRLTPQPRILDCGGKRSATPLLDATGRTESGVAAALCHRSPNLCRLCSKLQDCSTDREKILEMQRSSPISEAFRVCVRDFLSGLNPCPSVSIRGLIKLIRLWRNFVT